MNTPSASAIPSSFKQNQGGADTTILAFIPVTRALPQDVGDWGSLLPADVEKVSQLPSGCPHPPNAGMSQPCSLGPAMPLGGGG